MLDRYLVLCKPMWSGAAAEGFLEMRMSHGLPKTGKHVHDVSRVRGLKTRPVEELRCVFPPFPFPHTH